MALQQPKDALLFNLSKAMAEAFPDRHLLETESWAFDLMQFWHDGHCEVSDRAKHHTQWSWDWDQQHSQEYSEPRIGWFDIKWQGKMLEAVLVAYAGHHSVQDRWYLL